MAAIDIIKRRLKEDRVPDIPDEVGEKKKRPREVAFMDMNLCFPCGKCPEFCPVQCIEYLAPHTLPGRGVQPVQDRFQECIGCYIKTARSGPGTTSRRVADGDPFRMPTAVASLSLVRTRPWTWPWWRPAAGQQMTLMWVVLIHVTAAVGLVMCPLPGWSLLLAAGALTWVGGLGTTVCYHRALAHRALRLHPAVQEVLIFFAMYNGSGAPRSWTANHRLHHATADTFEDISSPQVGGFWWAHLRWLWQAGHAAPARYCPDLSGTSYRIWAVLQIPLLAVSFLSGLAFGTAAFFWLGAIRLVFALHGQCFVNSVCHLRPGTPPGDDSSRNVRWLTLWHCFQGENWHRNHHARPGSARFGWTVTQLDAGWWVIVGLERLGLATEVRRPSVFCD